MNRDVPVVAAGVRAVDVGYFNVKYTHGRKLVGDANTISTELFPALAPRLMTNDVMEHPGVNACTVNVQGVNYVVGPGAVFHTSASEPRPIDVDYAATDRYHALMLGALHYMAEDAGAGQEFVIGRLVLGLPLNSYHRNVRRLTDRATGEHVIGRAGSDQRRRVTVRSVHVMVQPHGALLNFGVARAHLLKDNGWTLVIDPGGGTLDWFMARGTTPNWSRSGAYSKAMLHCAYAIADLINPHWRTQYEIVEAIDLALRTKSEVFKIGAREFRVSDFRGCVDALLEESVKHMIDKTGPLDSVGRILITGGGAPVFHEFLLRRQPALAPVIQIDSDPVFSNVRGFQISGEVLERALAA